MEYYADLTFLGFVVFNDKGDIVRYSISSGFLTFGVLAVSFFGVRLFLEAVFTTIRNVKTHA